MKTHRSNNRSHALTLVEVLAVVVILFILAAMLLPGGNNGRAKSIAKKIACANNLKQIGLSEKLWAGDHGDKFPFELSVTNGGTMELNTGTDAWKYFLVMSNELSTPKILICPADDEHWPAATNFSSQLAAHISYFITRSSDEDPQALISGDDNFEIGGVPVKPGWLILSTNTPIRWMSTRHNRLGNVLFADGSIQGINNSRLTNLLHQTGLATNRLAIP